MTEDKEEEQSSNTLLSYKPDSKEPVLLKCTCCTVCYTKYQHG